MPTRSPDAVPHQDLVGLHQFEEVAVTAAAAILGMRHDTVGHRHSTRPLDEYSSGLEMVLPIACGARPALDVASPAVLGISEADGVTSVVRPCGIPVYSRGDREVLDAALSDGPGLRSDIRRVTELEGVAQRNIDRDPMGSTR